ncbi:MAG TPA: MlaD family protein [Solirubrobacteraceae bacterium]|nr:MlaD family protein [Solirubrobacteraceae bacterium]
MRSPRKTALEVFDNPILIGTVTILVALVAVYLSYIAENGLPFVPTYNIKVDVTNAAELTKNADVRIGGARVGQVLTITPEPRDTDKAYPAPFARLGLQLQTSLDPLPYDSHYEVRLASVLGGKYLEIIPGNDRNTQQTPALPDGGTFRLSDAKGAIHHNLPFVDLDTAFDTFGPKTQSGLRHAVAEFGDAFAGRGTQFNDAIYSLHQLIGPLDNLLGLFAARSTHLSEFISGLAATTSALAPVSPTISSLLNHGATTFAALDTPALGTTIDQLPSTESVGTTVLTNSLPVLQDAASITQELKPSAALLPTAANDLDAIITSATPAFRRVPRLASALQTALVTVDSLARDPASTETFNVLGSSDLATFGSSAFIGLGAILRTVAPAQFACNVAGLWVRNFASALSTGDATGGWLRFAPLIDLNQMLPASKPASDLHDNFYPIEDSSQCQAGNEGYTGKQLIGNPPKTSAVVENTTPPPGVLALGRKAGLVP